MVLARQQLHHFHQDSLSGCWCCKSCSANLTTASRLDWLTTASWVSDCRYHRSEKRNAESSAMSMPRGMRNVRLDQEKECLHCTSIRDRFQQGNWTLTSRLQQHCWRMTFPLPHNNPREWRGRRPVNLIDKDISIRFCTITKDVNGSRQRHYSLEWS